MTVTVLPQFTLFARLHYIFVYIVVYSWFLFQLLIVLHHIYQRHTPLKLYEQDTCPVVTLSKEGPYSLVWGGSVGFIAYCFEVHNLCVSLQGFWGGDFRSTTVRLNSLQLGLKTKLLPSIGPCSCMDIHHAFPFQEGCQRT